MLHTKRSSSLLASLFLSFSLLGCAQVDVHGHHIDPETLDTIEMGKTTKEEVVEILGTPASVATFQDNTWYYISEKTRRTVSFMKPDVLESRTVILSFDDKGRVKDIQEKGAQDKKVVAHVGRSTPTAGRSFGFFEQLLGNVGRLGKPDQDELEK
ncbi:Outer membrane protein assembly factor BamE domain protein [Candidatus Bealeia paramacronuclearis]|uniref:Outer membrane protein assembly factor BamE domain protein n=1 Tax=Candidatus Bealeia paramacronuclearis TaxID=1921001 RepID=A0ABZ2C4I8_9PROT|nr:Outer membrane protein assembly factor BamE domain protein [Candidatus Bealeia paramacronuclearis]